MPVISYWAANVQPFAAAGSGGLINPANWVAWQLNGPVFDEKDGCIAGNGTPQGPVNVPIVVVIVVVVAIDHRLKWVATGSLFR